MAEQSRDFPGRNFPEFNPPLNPMTINMHEIVKQLADLVHLVLECEKKELAPNISFAEVNQQLLILRNAIDLLNRSYVQTLNSLSLSEDEVQQYRKNIEDLKEPERDLLLELHELQQVCKQARDRVDASLQKAMKNAPKLLQFSEGKPESAALNEKEKPKPTSKMKGDKRRSRKSQKKNNF